MRFFLKAAILLGASLLPLTAYGEETGRRQMLLGLDATKLAEVSDFSDAIYYVQVRLGHSACIEDYTYNLLPVKNGFGDYPNSQKYSAFLTLAFTPRKEIDCAPEIEKIKVDLAQSGVDVIKVSEAAQKLPPAPKVIALNEETLLCGNRPHFPTGYSLLLDGTWFSAFIIDDCKKFNATLELAASQGGIVKATLFEVGSELIEFSNAQHPPDDVRLTWKFAHVARLKLVLENGLAFGVYKAEYTDIAHP